MNSNGYGAAVSCKLSGVHRLDDRTGRCLACGTVIVKLRAAPPALETVGEKSAAAPRPPPRPAR